MEALSDMGINEIQTHRAVGDCIDTAMLISAATLKQYDKADTQLNTMTDATLEDRYTEAMKLLGYERVNADDEIVSIVFENGNNRIGFDGWSLVGDYLEDISLKPESKESEMWEALLHPKNRITYSVSTKDNEHFFTEFDKALQFYIDIGIENKSLNFVNESSRDKFEIVQFSTDNTATNNVLNNYNSEILSKSNLTVNERDKLCIALNAASYKLKRNNVYNIIKNEFDKLIAAAKSKISANYAADGKWNCIIANDKRPQDYVSINIIGDALNDEVKITVAVLHSNETVDDKRIRIHLNPTDEDSLNNFVEIAHENFKDLIFNSTELLDTDYESKMIVYNHDCIEVFEQKLEDHEYYDMPDLSGIVVENFKTINAGDDVLQKNRLR